MRHISKETDRALARAKLASEIRVLAEGVLGVQATVDLPASKLARMLGDLLALEENSTTVPGNRRQRSLFGEDGRRYSFDVRGQVRIVLCGECLLLCPVCGGLAPLELRAMTNGEEIRNQPRCGRCRNVKE